MTTGEVHEVSLSIGELRSDVRNLERAVAEGNASRRDMHEKVNTVINSMTEMTAKVQTLCGTVETLAATVKTHETIRQQGTGMKTLLTAAMSGGGVVGILEALKHFIK